MAEWANKKQWLTLIPFIVLLVGLALIGELSSQGIILFLGKLFDIPSVPKGGWFISTLISGAIVLFIIGVTTYLFSGIEWRRFKAASVRFQQEYILIELPEAYKGLFQDVLRGFEDYCALKGYKIKISIDNSFKDKIAFKINLDETSQIKEAQLQEDLKEFLRRVRTNDGFDDLTSEEPRQFEKYLRLQNRINILENDKRNLSQMLKWQEKFLDKLSDPNFKIQPMQTQPLYFQIGDGGFIMPKQQNVGDGSILVSGDNNTVSHKITISNSFNTRKEQIGKITELLNLLKDEAKNNQGNSDKLDELETCLYQIKGSLTNENNPDANQMFGWLQTIKNLAEKLVLVHHTKEAIEWIMYSFGILK